MARNIINPKYQDKKTIYLDEDYIESIERQACEEGKIILKDYSKVEINFTKKVMIKGKSSWNSSKTGELVEVIGYTNHIAYVKFPEETTESVLKQKKLSNIYELKNLHQWTS